jgi:hypothetical protein
LRDHHRDIGFRASKGDFKVRCLREAQISGRGEAKHDFAERDDF